MNEPGFTTVVVASGADSAYACPLAVMIRSVLLHAPPSVRVDFQIIDSGLTPDDRLRILRSIDPARSSIHWIAPRRESLAGLPLWGRMSIATYDKLLLAELLDPSLHRALWLDADVLVLTDISQLWAQSEADQLALACTDPLVPTVASTFGVADWKKLQLPPESPYFNAGVLLVALDAWQANRISSHAIEYLRDHHERVYFWDQEALNAVLANRWAPIDPAWNATPDRIPPDATPHLIHFSGNLKPWRHFGSSRWHQLYYDCLDQTDWKGWLDALLEAMDGPFAIVLPSITNACPNSLIGWANYILDYSRLRPELPRGEVHSGLGHNTAYQTRLLLALGDQLDLALDHYEERLLSDLQPQKPRIGFEPGVRLQHVGVTLLMPALEERLLLGLLTGASRARRWPLHQRLLYFLASPLIALVLVARELPGARTAIAAGQTSIAVLPVMLLLCVVKAIGEAWGYLFGCPEWTRAREAELEIQRLRYARRFTP